MENEKPKFEGQSVRLGGEEYILPSLSVKQARALWPEIIDMDGTTLENLPDKHEKMIKVIHSALIRNYPSMTLEQIEDLVDLVNIRSLFQSALGTSGLAATSGLEPVAEKTHLVQ